MDVKLLKPFKLGADGIAYVKSRLEKAGDLSSSVNKLFNNSGESFAPLPEDINPQQAKDFEYANQLPVVAILLSYVP